MSLSRGVHVFFRINLPYFTRSKKGEEFITLAECARQILQHAEDEEEVTTVTAKEGGLRL